MHSTILYKPLNWYTGLPTGVFSDRLKRDISPDPGIKWGILLMSCPVVKRLPRQKMMTKVVTLVHSISIKFFHTISQQHFPPKWTCAQFYSYNNDSLVIVGLFFFFSLTLCSKTITFVDSQDFPSLSCGLWRIEVSARLTNFSPVNFFREQILK